MAEATQAQGPPHPIPPQEQVALADRRRLNDIDWDEPTIGLALSGGGVRSATFCIGLLRALAKNGVLRRFDYMSTVSGGGYAGAAFGRLFSAKVKPEQVEKALADDQSLLLWWLRSNGRYLVPAGARDLLQTWAGQLRGFIATQFEVTTLAALLSCLIVLPHLLGYRGDPGSFWWLATLLPLWLGVFMAFTYWWSRDPRDGTVLNDFITCISTALIGVYLVWRHIAMAADIRHGRTAMLVIGLILLAVPLSRLWLLRRRARPARDRVRYTVGLSKALKYVLLLLVLGGADLLSWYLADQVGNESPNGSLLTSAGLAALLVAVARFTLPMVQSRANKKGTAQLPLALLANVCGLLLIGVLALFWLSALQYFVFMARVSATEDWMHWLVSWFPGFPQTPAAEAWLRWLTVFLPCLAYIVLTGRNLQQINRSSLHAFYRSRIARTYVAVGNSHDHRAAHEAVRFPVSPLSDRTPGNAAKVQKLTDLLEGDDVDLPAYVPHAHGGPIHLINCCINQTIDDRTDTYNADRKGVYLSISALGLETGTRPARPHAQTASSIGHTSLAEWIAISGAAAGSGMGSLTRTGTAALFFLSGLRLGYWWANHLGRKSWWWSHLGKTRAALQEMLARFPGLQNPVWYLSDGGHFDNTGIYSLLKRELSLIVLADCGADANYVFADLENLTRKARIDMDIAIDFIDPASLPASASAVLRARLGTPDSITPCPGSQHLLLARISYPSGASGCLLVVKPRLVCELPLDVAGYADGHRDFPQQSTAEQFFDESQWESYCQLGVTLGAPLDAALIKLLPSLAGEGSIARVSVVSDEEQKTAQTRRQRIGATIGASLSLGAIATVAVTGWQTWDSHQQDVRSEQQGAQTQQSEADSIQTDLEADQPYDAKMHVRLYALMQKFEQSGKTGGIPHVMNRLADQLNHSCGLLTADNPLNQRCLLDYAALRAAATEPSGWRRSMLGYASATPQPLLSVGEWFGSLQSGQPARVASATPTPTAPEAVVPASGAAAPPPPPAEGPAPLSPTASAGHPVSAAAQAPAPSAGETAEVSAAPPPRAPKAVPLPSPASHAGSAATRTVGEAAPSAGAGTEVAGTDVRQACGATASATPGPFVVYIQIYDDSQRAMASHLMRQLGTFGLSIPGIENVTQTARNAGHRQPASWPRPVLLYNASNDQAQTCARALADWLGRQATFIQAAPIPLPLPTRLHGDAKVIEFWIPVTPK
ncbi:MAG: patatin-like phospholipase family protein [Rhodanobacter sp.]